MLFYPRQSGGELAPIFRLVDDYTSHIAAASKPATYSIQRSSSAFEPKFDVKENKDSYELHGELPGVQQKDISIEFRDPQTLSIRGRVERLREQDEPSTVASPDQSEESRVAEGAEQEGYHYPTVEDEASVSTDTQGEAPKTQQDTTTLAPQSHEKQQVPKSNESKYWLSERRIGEFARAFSFAARVDQDGVKATLRDGILRVVVPKAAAPQSRRIDIE